MKLSVERLNESPQEFSFEAEPEWCERAKAAAEELANLQGPLRFELRAHLMGQDVYLEGKTQGSLELGCGRCLARYVHPVDETFRLVLEPAGNRVPAEPEAAAALDAHGLCLGDELDSGWFRGSEIDLGTYFLEVVTLALPFQPVCREDCQGLCPRCGADRNQQACGCEQAQPDSPFAALASLRGGGEN